MTSAAEQKMTPSAVRASSFRVCIRAELAHDELEVAIDRGEVGAREVDMWQRGGCSSGMHTVIVQDGCWIVKRGRATPGGAPYLRAIHSLSHVAAPAVNGISTNQGGNIPAAFSEDGP